MARRRRSTPPAPDGRRRRVRPEPSDGASTRRRRPRPGDADEGAATAADPPRSADRPHHADAAAGPGHDDAAPLPWWRHPLVRAGAYAWAVLGLVVLAVAATLAMGALRLVVVPLLLALFPAALLSPIVGWLRDARVPRAVAALVTILGVLIVLVGVGTLLAPQVADEAPALVESVQQGIGEVEQFLDDTAPFGFDAADLRAQLDQIDTGALFDLARAGALGAAAAVAETAGMALLLLVVLFFYLKDGDRLGRWLCGLFPGAVEGDAEVVGRRAWTTIGAYFRGQLLVAVVDAVGIGVGLWVLGVPLALPLAVLVFFGGLFPIVGAIATGAVAVLVALAASGAWAALAVLGVVVAVQQFESNVLAPLVLGKATALHPLGVLTAITAGGVLLGVLGAFLAVPVAASVTRGIGAMRERRRPDGSARPVSASAD